MGAAYGSRGRRVAHPDDFRFPELMKIRFRTLATAALFAVALLPLEASSPKFFQVATQNDFLKGDVENLSIDNHGQLRLGPQTELVYETSAPFLWSMIAAHVTALAFDKNGNLLAGTGTPGKVLRIDPEGKAFVLLDSPFQEIRTLRFDDKGTLYVAAISGRPGAGSAPVTTELIDRPVQEPLNRAPVPSVSAEITSMSIVDVSGGSGSGGSP